MANIFNPGISNIIAVTHQLLHLLKVRSNLHTLSATLKAHPSYPSLLAISDCLTVLNVKHQIYHLKKEQYDPVYLSFPFLTHFQQEGGHFVLVQSLNNGVFKISDEHPKIRFVPEAEFFESWQGILFNAQPDAKSGESDFRKNRKYYILQQLRLPAFLLTLFSLFYLLSGSDNLQWFYLLLGILKLIGITISLLLLTHRINANHSILQTICRPGKKNYCNQILNSAAARISSWLSWSEAGFFYFSGSFLVLVIYPSLSPALAWLNLLTLPYIVYSISYQYRTKNYCTLCCAVQIVFLAECILFNINRGSLHLNFNTLRQHLPPLSVCFLLPALCWSLLKPLFLKVVLMKPLQAQLNTFKYNADLFAQALNSQKNYEVSKELLPIILGDMKASTIITMLSNPYCAPCAKAHHFIEELLLQRDDLQVKLLFVNDDQEKELSTQVARHLIALNLLNDKNIVIKAVHDWYSQKIKKYETWAAEYPVRITEEVDIATASQKNWCNQAAITFTPTILINGYKLPAPYKLEDIKYLIN